MGCDNTDVEFYSEMFGCKIGSLPMKYMGVPVSFKRLKNADLACIDSKV